MGGWRDTKRHVKENLETRKKCEATPERMKWQRKDKGSLATLSPVFPGNRGKAVSYQVITGQEAEPSVASQLVKATPFTQN